MVSKKSKLIFLMPPKTASNSLTESLLDSSIKFDELDVKYPKIHLFLSELVEAHDIKNPEKYKIIQLVRDPMDKYISSYFHQLRILKNAKTKINNLSFEEFTEHFYDCLINSDNFLKSFYGNTKIIEKIIESGKSWAGTRLYLNQTQWNDLNMPISYFKLENLTNGLDEISDLINVYLPDMPQKNKGTNREKIEVSHDVKMKVKTIFYDDYKILNYA